MTPLSPEAIVEAALDDEAFAALPGALAGAVDARSAVVHWSSSGAHPVGELRHSRHFSDAQIALLDEQFEGHDLWANALGSPGMTGRVWRCEALVSTRAYERGRLYNDWIRPIGDDSFWGLGFVSRSAGVSVEVGLHRGRSQGGFTSEAAAAVAAMVRPIEQLLLLRARLAAAGGAGATALAALHALGDPVLIVDSGGVLREANAAAEQLLTTADVMVAIGGKLRARLPADDVGLQRALWAARLNAAGSTVLLSAPDGRRHPCQIDAIVAGGRRQVMLTLRAATAEDRTKQAAALYGLSPTEAAVVAAVALGHAPDQIAAARHTSRLTVRSQLKSAMGKMNVRRQSELAALFALLPSPATKN